MTRGTHGHSDQGWTREHTTHGLQSVSLPYRVQSGPDNAESVNECHWHCQMRCMQCCLQRSAHSLHQLSA